jgi:hypothetical protein
MDIKNLVRDASKVHASLHETKNGQLVAAKACKIYIPTRFEDCRLANIASDIRVVGIFMISVEDKYYGVSLANAMMSLTPTTTSIVTVAEEDYYEFTFEKGSVVCPNMDLVKDDKLVYSIYDEIIAKGHVPWYFSYEDLGKLFATAKYHGGINLGSTNAPLEMIAAAISRDMKDRTKYYRHSIKTLANQYDTPPAFIAFRNVIHGATNTTAKLMGAYFDDGLMSALVNPSTKTEGIEDLLRR